MDICEFKIWISGYMQMASDMSFIMKNWTKGRKNKLRTSEQAKFDAAYDSILKYGQ